MDRDPMELVRSWMFDLHMTGRKLSYSSKEAAELAAADVFLQGGSLSAAFAAARKAL